MICPTIKKTNFYPIASLYLYQTVYLKYTLTNLAQKIRQKEMKTNYLAMSLCPKICELNKSDTRLHTRTQEFTLIHETDFKKWAKKDPSKDWIQRQ